MFSFLFGYFCSCGDFDDLVMLGQGPVSKVDLFESDFEQLEQ